MKALFLVLFPLFTAFVGMSIGDRYNAVSCPEVFMWGCDVTDPTPALAGTAIGFGIGPTVAVFVAALIFIRNQPYTKWSREG